MKNKIDVIAAVIIIILIVLLTFTPAKASPPGASWYRQYAAETVIIGNQWNILQGNFDITQNGGLYTYSNGWFTTTYTGLVKLSGNCLNEKGKTITMRLFRQSSGFETWHSLSEYDNQGVISFNVAFIADNIQIQLWSSSFAVLKCNLLFEVVQ